MLGTNLKEFKKAGVFIINENQLSAEQGKFATEYFREQVMPYLFPIMLEKETPTPYLKDHSVYLVIKLQCNRKKKKTKID